MDNLLWMDLETTGLDNRKDVILEVSAIITNKYLDVVSSHNFLVFQTEDELSKMNDFVRKMHTRSGLLNDIEKGISIQEVDNSLIEILKDFKEKIILHGNSIHFDRGFINFYLPKTASKLNYRMIDVSTFKECLRIYDIGITPTKKETHRATEDILESIAEYRYYLNLLNIQY